MCWPAYRWYDFERKVFCQFDSPLVSATLTVWHPNTSVRTLAVWRPSTSVRTLTVWQPKASVRSFRQNEIIHRRSPHYCRYVNYWCNSASLSLLCRLISVTLPLYSRLYCLISVIDLDLDAHYKCDTPTGPSVGYSVIPLHLFHSYVLSFPDEWILCFIDPVFWLPWQIRYCLPMKTIEMKDFTLVFCRQSYPYRVPIFPSLPQVGATVQH